MMMGIGHFRPRASMVKAVTGAGAGTTARSASVKGTELASAACWSVWRDPGTPGPRPNRRARRSVMRYSLLASGALLGAAFPRRSFLAPQSRQRRAPAARSCGDPHVLHDARLRFRYARQRAKMTQTRGVVEGSRVVRDTVCTTRCSRTEEGPRLDYR